MTIREWCWLAGFYEGEGSCGTYRRTSRYKQRTYVYPYGRFGVSICQRQRSIIDWICRTTGIGSIHLQKQTTKLGRAVWVWNCSQRQGAAFMKALLPYMRTTHKINHAKEAIRLYEKYTKV